MRLSVSTWCVIGFTALTTLGVARAEISRPLEHVPADVAFCVITTDLEEALERYQRTTEYKAAMDPVGQEVLSEYRVFASTIEAFKQRVAEILETEPSRLENPFGRFALIYATLPERRDDDDLGGVVALGVAQRAVMDEYFDRVLRFVSKQVDDRESESFAGNTIYAFTNRPAADDTDDAAEERFDEDFEADVDGPDDMAAEMVDSVLDPTNLPAQFAFCYTGTEFIVGPTADDIKQFLRGAANDALSEHPDFRRIDQLFADAGLTRIFVNLPAILAAMQRDAPETRRMQRALGLDSFGSIVGHMRHAGDRVDSRIDLMALMRGERTGIARLLSMENTPFEPPAIFAADSLMYASLQLEPLKVYEEIERITRQIDPVTADQMAATVTELEIAPGEFIDLKRDVLAVLRPPLAMGFRFARPYSTESVRVLITMRHADRAGLLRIGELAGMVPRDVAGTTILDAQFPPSLSIAVTDTTMIMGNRPAVETAVQAGATDALRAAAPFRSIKRIGLADGTAFFYTNGDEANEVVAGLLENTGSGELPMPMFDPFAMFAWSFLEGVLAGGETTPEKLEAVRKYTQMVAMMMQTTPDGVRVSFITVPASAVSQ